MDSRYSILRHQLDPTTEPRPLPARRTNVILPICICLGTSSVAIVALAVTLSGPFSDGLPVTPYLADLVINWIAPTFSMGFAMVLMFAGRQTAENFLDYLYTVGHGDLALSHAVLRFGDAVSAGLAFRNTKGWLSRGTLGIVFSFLVLQVLLRRFLGAVFTIREGKMEVQGTATVIDASILDISRGASGSSDTMGKIVGELGLLMFGNLRPYIPTQQLLQSDDFVEEYAVEAVQVTAKCSTPEDAAVQVTGIAVRNHTCRQVCYSFSRQQPATTEATECTGTEQVLGSFYPISNGETASLAVVVSMGCTSDGNTIRPLICSLHIVPGRGRFSLTGKPMPQQGFVKLNDTINIFEWSSLMGRDLSFLLANGALKIWPGHSANFNQPSQWLQKGIINAGSTPNMAISAVEERLSNLVGVSLAAMTSGYFSKNVTVPAYGKQSILLIVVDRFRVGVAITLVIMAAALIVFLNTFMLRTPVCTGVPRHSDPIAWAAVMGKVLSDPQLMSSCANWMVITERLRGIQLEIGAVAEPDKPVPNITVDRKGFLQPVIAEKHYA
ncbi:hypothetical protein HK102_007863 [Quaeritorhiza haematococci]|nr:hypothetical protein HK102_007863 [Quaeritorhiza haematococci]